MAATLIFIAVSLALVLVWNALFRPVPWRIVIAIYIAIAIYQGETLFTRKVDLPGRLAYHAYPWKALGREPVRANTGIAFQQLIAWTETAREIVKAGEAPLWNRRIGSGTPLLSDQQSTIAHPFTLLGLYLSIGKAFTLSVALRLFFALFFFFVFLRNWDFRDGPALFGAIAYGFSTFHIVTLLMPLGLTMMSLPMALGSTDELMRRPRARSFAFVVIALTMTVLAGHPEAEMWVGLTTGAYALFLRRAKPLMLAACAALAAILLTAFFWYPTVALVRLSNRYALMSALLEHPPRHVISAPWFEALVAPNILGTVHGGTYKPPEPRFPDLLDDYGEVACGYTGIITLALALAALPLAFKHRLGIFAVGAIAIALLLITEPPFLRSVPILNISLLQRFRFLWNLGVVILAVIALDARVPRKQITIASLFVLLVLSVLFVLSSPPALSRFETFQLLAPLAFLIVLPFIRCRAVPLALLVLADLLLTTWRYNAPSAPEDVLPMTGAIAAMQTEAPPYRIVARGWSLLPDTPGWYGLEDVKSTSPFTTPEYLRLFSGYFAASGFEQIIGATKYPFCDYLNVRYIYVPPGDTPLRDDVVEIYRGADGAVFRNDRALPRYFLARHFDVEPDFGMTVARMKNEITDYRARTLVDHIPEKVARLAGAIPNDAAGGAVRLVKYGPNETQLDVVSNGWNLLVSSDEWFPGWRVYWNGRRMPHVRVNGAFAGVFVPPGRGIVRLRYQPKEFGDGVKVSAATLFVLVLAATIHVGLRKRRNASAPQSAPAA
jgi:hypothetical protein